MVLFYGKPFRRVGRTLQGAADDLIGTDVARSYSRMFGISGGSETASLSKAMAERDISGLKRKGWLANRLTSLHGFIQTAELAETATRLGLFRTFKDEAKKRGLDDYEALLEAAWRARDYLDFDRRGSGMAALAKVTPFLNASLQGLDKATRHMITPLAKQVLGKAQGPEDAAAVALAAKTWARLSAVVVGSISLYALMSQHEDHDEISETTRSTHWMIKFGEKWIAVPKPYEFAIAINLGEAIFDTWAKKDPTAMQRWRDSLYLTVMPPSVIEGNPAIKSYFELKSNTDFFTGAPIVPDQLLGLEPWLQYTARTSAISKQLGYLFNEPPVIIDHLVTGHLGSIGRNAVSLYDLAQPDAPGFAWDDAPISRRFIKDASKGAQSVTKFWDLVGEREGALEGKVKSWKAMAEAGDAASAADYFASLPPIDKAYVAVSALDADARRLHPMIRARGAIQAIGTVRRELASGRLTDEDGNSIKISPAERTAADDILSTLSMAMARNGLKEAGVAGWAQRSEIDETTFYRELEAVSPALSRRLGDAFAEKRVWDFEAVKEAWPELKARALENGSSAFTADLVATVKASGLALDGEKRGRKAKPELVP
ncbi:MAG: LPD38 domain-containing protein [Rhizobium giardinii]